MTRLRNDNPVRIYLKSVCGDGRAVEEHVVTALLRLHLAGHESDLRHTYRDLVDTIGQTRGLASSCTLETIYRIADNLIHRIYMASSKVLAGDITELYKADADINQVRDKMLLAGKRLLPADIEGVIDQSLQDSASNLLVTNGLVGADVLPPGMDVMRQKLAAGGVQQERVGVIEDSVASFQKAYLEWAYKGDVKSANGRLQHLQALVRDDCAEAKILGGRLVEWALRSGDVLALASTTKRANHGGHRAPLRVQRATSLGYRWRDDGGVHRLVERLLPTEDEKGLMCGFKT